MTTPRLTAWADTWPLSGEFRIARGAKTAAHVVTVQLTDGPAQTKAAQTGEGQRGRGQSVPYARYGETIDAVVAECRRFNLMGGPSTQGLPPFNAGFDLERTRDDKGAPLGFKPGAARNALDCALWDWEAKRTGKRVWELAGLPAPEPRITAFTVSIDHPEAMADAALLHADKPVLKMKLAGDGLDSDRLRAVRAVRDDAQIIVDANEGFDLHALMDFARLAADLGVALIEQPLPADQDAKLAGFKCPVPLCADESMHTAADLERLSGLYQAVNIKLDKTGGLTEALTAARRARELGLTVMVGCMVGTSLSMAPAFMLESFAAFIDLDGPLLLARDWDPGIVYDGAIMHPPSAKLWG